MTALFSKNKKKEEELKNVQDVDIKEEETSSAGQGSSAFSGTGSSDVHKVLKGFYVSEKASVANSLNQYVFRVFSDANKSEVKKEVSKLFNVKVVRVRMLN